VLGLHPLLTQSRSTGCQMEGTFNADGFRSYKLVM